MWEKLSKWIWTRKDCELLSQWRGVIENRMMIWIDTGWLEQYPAVLFETLTYGCRHHGDIYCSAQYLPFTTYLYRSSHSYLHCFCVKTISVIYVAWKLVALYNPGLLLYYTVLLIKIATMTQWCSLLRFPLEVKRSLCCTAPSCHWR